MTDAELRRELEEHVAACLEAARSRPFWEARDHLKGTLPRMRALGRQASQRYRDRYAVARAGAEQSGFEHGFTSGYLAHLQAQSEASEAYRLHLYALGQLKDLGDLLDILDSMD